MLPHSCPKQSSRKPVSKTIIILILLDIIRPCMAWVPTALSCSHQQREESSLTFSVVPIQSGRILKFSTYPLSYSRAAATPLYATSGDDSIPSDENGETGNEDEDMDQDFSDDDAALYREYQKAKLDKLGWGLPSEQLKVSAESAEAEFLRAMQECQQEFEKAKEEVDDKDALSAADFFLEQIKKEETLEELWQKRVDYSEQDIEEDEDAFQ